VCKRTIASNKKRRPQSCDRRLSFQRVRAGWRRTRCCRATLRSAPATPHFLLLLCQEEKAMLKKQYDLPKDLW